MANVSEVLPETLLQTVLQLRVLADEEFCDYRKGLTVLLVSLVVGVEKPCKEGCSIVIIIIINISYHYYYLLLLLLLLSLLLLVVV